MENFALRAKKAIRKVAAISVGVAMLGATMGGAFAADSTLADYPSPFTGSNGAIIVGNSADDAAAADIALGLPKVSSGTSSGSKTEGQISANVPLGMGIANSTSSGLDWEIGKSLISSFQKGKINFQSKDYDAKDELVLSKSTPNVATSLSSGTAVQVDYEDKVFLETTGREKIAYYYVFDDSINVSKATSSNSLEIKFLGKTLKITSVDSTDTTKFTAYITNQYFMNVGDSVTIENKKVKLENVGSTGALLISVDGVIDTIASGNAKTINGIEIANDQTFYDSNNKAQRAATLFIGKNAQNTFKDGDAFIGENENEPNWVWDTGSLATSASTSITQTNAGTIASTGPKIGIVNDFLRQSASQNPPGMGECLDLPNNYASICLDSLTVKDEDYMTVNIELDKNEDTSRSGQVWGGTSQNVIRFTTPTDHGFIIKANSLDENANSSVDRKTNKIWVASNGTSAAGIPLVIYYFDPDKSPTMQFAGTALLINASDGDGTAYSPRTKGEQQLFLLNYESSKDSNVNFTATLAGSGPTVNDTIVFKVQQNADSTNDLEADGDIININFTLTAEGGNFSSLGRSASTEEDGELQASPTLTNATAYSIGKKDVNLRTRYGTIIKDPKSNGASDKVVLAIPGDIVKAKVVVKGTAVAGTTSTGSTSSANILNADTVTDITQYNAVLVGGPCANKLTAQVMGASSTWPDCAKDFKAGEAILDLKKNGSNYALIVAGYSADDTKRAAMVLKSVAAKEEKFFLTGTSKIVKGTSLEVAGITVE